MASRILNIVLRLRECDKLNYPVLRDIKTSLGICIMTLERVGTAKDDTNQL